MDAIVPKEPRRVLRRVSPSQVQRFRLCPRKWAWSSVYGVREPERPNQKLGTDAHKATEDHLAGRPTTVKGKKALALFEAWRPTLPAPGADLLLEHPFEFPAYADGPIMNGRIDLVNPRGLAVDGVLAIDDHKTTKDLVWCRTPDELQRDVQAIIYARWGYGLTSWPTMFPVPPTEAWRPAWDDGVDVVRFAHRYVRTEGSAKVRMVPVDLPWELVAREWTKVQDDVRAMVALAATAPESPLGVEPRPSACSAYGGCHFSKAGACSDVASALVPTAARAPRKGEHVEKVMALKDRLRLRQAAEGKGEAPCPGCGAAITPANSSVLTSGEVKHVGCGGAAKEPALATGIVPPDAPPRTSTPDEVKAEEAAVAAKSRKRKPKEPLQAPTAEQVEQHVEQAEQRIEAAAEAAKARLDEAPPEPAKRPSSKRVVFVDSVLADASSVELFGHAPVDLELWMEPLRRAVASSFGEADYGLIDFKARAALAVAVDEALDTCPPVVAAWSMSRGYDVFAEKAKANGWHLVRAVRG